MKPFAFAVSFAAVLLATGPARAAPPESSSLPPSDTSRATAPPAPLWGASAQWFATMDRQAAMLERQGSGLSLSYLADGSALAAARRDGRGTVVGVGAGGMSGRFFGLEASGLTPLEIAAADRFNAPYYGMVRDASHAGVSIVAGDGGRLRFGALSGQGTVLTDPFGQAINDRSKRFLSSAEFEQKMGRAVGIVSVGVLRENGSMLGSQLVQALAFTTNPTTTFTSLSVGYALSPSSSLVAMASSGRTAGLGATDSLLAQVSEVRTVAYSFGYSAKRLWRKDDRFGLTFSMPAKVRSGAMALGGPALQSPLTGALGDVTQPLNLHPTATERDLEMTYSTGVGPDARQGRVTGAMMLRVNPGHDATAKPDWMLGVRYVRGF
ncbi:hypothetical protein [Rugamonas apoptosis]|uniref:Porin n=1 Tax=Rugamonas apoptosis TaxID=2758570 RepID=A0A7W2FCX0_9BURK|nr:hypothetical protein [Rugamonas apoptosis]MBA5689441.1 hypothetical protein [Rugamonas apoptosis]